MWIVQYIAKQHGEPCASCLRGKLKRTESIFSPPLNSVSTDPRLSPESTQSTDEGLEAHAQSGKCAALHREPHRDATAYIIVLVAEVFGLLQHRINSV